MGKSTITDLFLNDKLFDHSSNPTILFGSYFAHSLSKDIFQEYSSLLVIARVCCAQLLEPGNLICAPATRLALVAHHHIQNCENILSIGLRCLAQSKVSPVFLQIIKACLNFQSVVGTFRPCSGLWFHRLDCSLFRL